MSIKTDGAQNNVKSVLIVGVGGQGTLLASRLLGGAMVRAGYDVKVSEVHGMSQRGGSVVTYVRYGDKVYSPIIEQGGADTVLAFEQLEAARFLPWLKPQGTMIVNTQQIDPMPVITGNAAYPDGLLEQMEGKGVHVVAADALALAEQAGSSKAVNVVLIGLMARRLELSYEEWIDTIRETVPPKFIDMNIKAFDLGYHYGA
ncbi:MAG TPA: indolepyruvate oxidoreductase subunit beta [Candidatus Gallacutalibacter stercoravium]|nr:indolepyruvate oxidoreductase subunit beta [Candidatus Gallacutalibacter stercoravium]